MQREFPAGLAVAFSRFARGFDYVGGQAGEFFLRLREVRVGVGRVEHMVRKRLRQRRLALLQFGEARFLLFGQFRARQAEIAQRVIEDLPALARQQREVAARGERLVLLIQRKVLPDARPELGHARQVFAVGGAQFRRIGDRVQMAGDTPRARQRFRRAFDCLDDVGPRCGRHGFAGPCDGSARVGEQHVERRRDMFGADLAEARQIGEIEERVVECRLNSGHGASCLSRHGRKAGLKSVVSARGGALLSAAVIRLWGRRPPFPVPDAGQIA